MSLTIAGCGRPDRTEEITNPLTLTASSRPSPTTVPSGPNPAKSPLGRYLLHPSQETSQVVHHVLRALAHLGHAALPLVIGVAVVLVTWRLAQVVIGFRGSRGGHRIEVRHPAEVDPKGSLALWRTMHSVLCARRGWLAPAPHAAFEMEGGSSGIHLGFWVPEGVSPIAVVRAVESAYPGARCEVGPARSSQLDGPARVCGEMRLARSAWRSICTDHAGDPMRTVLGAIATVNAGEQMVVQVLVRPAGSRQVGSLVRTVRSLHSGRPTALVPRLMAAWKTSPAAPARSDPFRAADVRHAVEKLSDLPMFEASIRFGVSGPVEARRHLRSQARQVSAAFGVYARDNHFVPRKRVGCRWRLDRRRLGRGHSLGLSEIAALAHLPYGEAIPGLVYAAAKPVGPPPGVLAGPGALDEDGVDGWL